MTQLGEWPKIGDIAFREASARMATDQLAAFVDPSDAVYTTSFLLAADAVIGKARQDRDLMRPDLAFLPAAYLYRHYLELELKHVVREGVRMGEISVTDNRLTRHDLAMLWRSAREVIEKCSPGSPCADDVDAVEALVHEFHELDCKSDAFRYSTDRNGNASLATVPQWVDLENLQRTMKGACSNFFEGLAGVMQAGDPKRILTALV